MIVVPAVEETHIFAIIAPLSLEMKCVSTVVPENTAAQGVYGSIRR